MRIINKIKGIWMSIKYPGKASNSAYMKYSPESDFNGKKVLNIGCGSATYRSKNVTNLDMYSSDLVDVVWDLSKTPLPFKDNEFDLIFANHVFEHVPNWWECFKECARIVKIGGKIEIWLPGNGGDSELGYRDHINTINNCSFVGVVGTDRGGKNLWEIEDKKKLGYVKDLKLTVEIVQLYNEWWIQIMPNKIQDWISRHLRNVVNQAGFIFEKQQGERLEEKLGEK